MSSSKDQSASLSISTIHRALKEEFGELGFREGQDLVTAKAVTIASVEKLEDGSWKVSGSVEDGGAL
ncbi:MAG: hypothetical protein EAZ21_09005, partial [Betaproteobacteria bacterium]